MKYFVFLSFFIGCFTTQVQAQNFKKGWILKNEGDTIKGYINYSNSLSDYRSCEFKTDLEDGIKVIYTAEQLKAYGFIEQGIFESKKISMKDSTSESQFLETLVVGRLKLYKMNRRTSDVVFCIEKESKLYNIKEKKLSPGQIHSENGLLKVLLYDCVSLRKKVQQTRINEKALVSIIEAYNFCKDSSSSTIISKSSGLEFSKYIIIGGAYSKLTKAANGYSYDNRSRPFIGMQFDFMIKRFNRFSLHISSLAIPTYQKKSETEDLSDYKITRDIKLKAWEVKVPLGFKYSIPKNNHAPFLNIGTSFTFDLYRTVNITETKTINNVLNFVDKIQEKPHETQLGFWMGIGSSFQVKKQKLNLELRYEHSTLYQTENKSYWVPGLLDTFSINCGVLF